MNHVSVSPSSSRSNSASSSNRAARRSARPKRAQQNRLRLGAAGLAGAICVSPTTVWAATEAVRLADANTYKKGEVGPKVQLLQPGYNATLSGSEAPIVVSVAGRKFAPKTLELFVDGLNASNGKLELDSTTTVALKWDTTLFKDGVHRLTVRVTDAQGFTGQSETQIYINNRGQSDSAAPVLTWLNVNEHDIFKGVIDFQLKASDNFGVKYVFVSINAAITPKRKPPLRQWLVNLPPYSFSFDTSRVPDGIYVLDALAIDERENEGHAPTRTFGVLNNSMNATLFDEKLWPSRRTGTPETTANVAPLAPKETNPATVEVPSGGISMRTGNPVVSKGGTSPVQTPQSKNPPRIVGNPEMPPAVVGPIEPTEDVLEPPAEAMTSIQGDYKGAISQGIGSRNATIIETPRTQPGRFAFGASRARETKQPTNSGEAQISSVTPEREGVQSTVEFDRTPSRSAAELRITPPVVKPRVANAQPLDATPLEVTPKENAPSQTSIVTQPIPSRTMRLATRIEIAPDFQGRATVPAPDARRTSPQITERTVAPAPTGGTDLSLHMVEKITTTATHSVPLPTPQATPSRTSIPPLSGRIARTEIEVPATAEVSIAPLSRGTAVTHKNAPRIISSNPLRGELNLKMFARIERETIGAGTTPEAATPEVATPNVATKTTEVVKPALPKFPIALRPGTETVQPKRDMGNAITLAPARSARRLPVSFIAPRDTFLSAIAAQHGVSTEMLAAVNNLPANAKIARGREVLFPREISVRLAGQPVTGDVASMQVGVTSITAFRRMFEQSGGEVKWDAAHKRVVARDGNREITLTIGSKNATVNQREVAMDMAAFLLSGRTMVPVRFFEKALAARVEWNPETGRLLVSVANAPTVG